MFRIGLSVYLMLATLAGPSFCCCQMSRLSARFVHWLRSDEANAAASTPSCCRHQAPTKDSQPPTHPEKPSCPCRDSSSERPALMVLEAEGAAQLHRDQSALADDLLDGDFLTSVLPLSTARIPASPARFFSFESGRDILSSLHILRC